MKFLFGMCKKFFPFAFISLCNLMVLNESHAQARPTMYVQPATASTNPSNHPWALTVTPAPVGGTYGQNTTPTINYMDLGLNGHYWRANGDITVEAGKVYTFRLSVIYGGGWSTNGQASYASINFYGYYTGSILGTSDWISSGGNPTVSGLIVNSTTISIYAWTYQAGPKVVAGIEDGTYNPAINAYVPLTAKVSSGKIPLSVDYYTWLSPNANVVLFSNRNMPQAKIDTFSPASGNADGSGLFRNTLNTTVTQPDITASVSTINAFNQPITLQAAVQSPLLPAKCRKRFECTIYYTPKEKGFTAENGFDETPQLAPGTNAYYGKSFLKAVRRESFGRLKTAAPGSLHYIQYLGSGQYGYANAPLGNHGNALVPSYSCAVSSSDFPLNVKITTQSSSIQNTFQSSSWLTADSGEAVNAGHIDLYYGEDWPTPGSSTIPRSTTFTESVDTPVVFVSY